MRINVQNTSKIATNRIVVIQEIMALIGCNLNNRINIPIANNGVTSHILDCGIKMLNNSNRIVKLKTPIRNCFNFMFVFNKTNTIKNSVETSRSRNKKEIGVKM